MRLEVRPLHPLFAAELLGADLTVPPTPELVETVEKAMTRYGVLAVRDQLISDADHIRFSRAFGPLELPPDYDHHIPRRMARELSDASNLTLDTGEILPADSPRRLANKGAERFHMDSYYSPLPLKWSLLLGHEVPPEKGDTEFVDCRIAYERLSPAMKAKLENLEVIFDYYEGRYRRGLMQPTPEQRASLPPRRHKLVQIAPDGRKTLFVGQSAVEIPGMSDAEATPLLEELYTFATNPDYVYAHKWRKGDLLIWDNRCMLHRATPFESFKYRRDVRRSTIHASGPETVVMRLSMYTADKGGSPVSADRKAG